MGPFCFIAVTLAAATGQLADVLQQDFRGGQFPMDVFSFYGGNAKLGTIVKDHVKPGPDGVRITLPGRDQPIGMVGFACKPDLTGDFEITLAYELLQGDEPQKGYGMGLSFWVVAETEASDIATVGRRVVPKLGHVDGTDRAHYTAAGKDIHDTKRFLTTDRRGKLRLTRVGTEVLYAAAGEDDPQFRELRREPFPAAAIKAVRVTADTGNGLGELDVRITDLRIRTGAPGPVAPPAARTDSGPPWRLIVLGVVAITLVVGFLWWAMRSRKPAEEEDEQQRPRARKRPPPGE